MPRPINPNKLTIDQLFELKSRVEAALSAKVIEERRALEDRLNSLARVLGPSHKGRGGPRGAVPPKYRNPTNPSETWAGRGLKPRWLTAAIKSGKKLEDFAIGATVKSKPTKKMSRTRKARK